MIIFSDRVFEDSPIGRELLTLHNSNSIPQSHMKFLNLFLSYHVWLPSGKSLGRKPRELIEISKRYSSSKRWQARQAKDKYSREAGVKGLKSRAAFKLLQVPSLQCPRLCCPGLMIDFDRSMTDTKYLSPVKA